MVGQPIHFAANGAATPGHLSLPPSNRGPAVIVLQEWWGLVPHIKGVCDRLAAEGFIALAPDLYHGGKASSPDEASRLMMALDIERAAKDLSGAVRYLQAHPGVTSPKIGVVGFCMGGVLSLYAACENREIGACAVFYGIHPKVQPRLETLAAPVLGIYGSRDRSVPPEQARELERRLRELGKHAEIHVYEGADHAFFNEQRPLVYHLTAAQDAWNKTLRFFRQHLAQPALAHP
jgi:carboxymethylenebutenolidase